MGGARGGLSSPLGWGLPRSCRGPYGALGRGLWWAELELEGVERCE